jgi:hypothetical protein
VQLAFTKGTGAVNINFGVGTGSPSAIEFSAAVLSGEVSLFWDHGLVGAVPRRYGCRNTYAFVPPRRA